MVRRAVIKKALKRPPHLLIICVFSSTNQSAEFIHFFRKHFTERDPYKIIWFV